MFDDALRGCKVYRNIGNAKRHVRARDSEAAHILGQPGAVGSVLEELYSRHLLTLLN